MSKFPWIVVGVFFTDRLTKLLALRFLAPHGAYAILPFFHLTYLENTGGAFGIGQGGNLRFAVIAAVVLPVLAWMRRRYPSLAVDLVIGGALGNLYDRLVYGHVIDFFDFRVWPVFNVADSCVSVGMAWLFLLNIRQRH